MQMQTQSHYSTLEKPHQNSSSEILRNLKSSLEEGLTQAEATQRLQLLGPNQLQEAKKKSLVVLFLSQFTHFLILILIGAALISAFLGDPEDMIAILAIILINACIGFVQEYRAEKSIEALKKLATPQAKVKRSQSIQIIPSSQLVPGDIVLIEAGNTIPADLRLLESVQLSMDESLLTGESLAAQKESTFLSKENLPLGDQKNMAFQGTFVRTGRGTGVVVQTGMRTELGKIAEALKEESKVETPLQKRMASFTKQLTFVALALCTVIFLIGVLYQGKSPSLMFLTAVSLAVAAIPEALPAVITITLALGARIMAKKNALIRKLPAVEALGSVTVICTDKTGTLTENKMKVEEIFLFPSQSSSLTEDFFFKALALNHTVTFGSQGEPQGDPTEVALVEAAQGRGIPLKEVADQFLRWGEVSFSSERGIMSTLHQSHDASASEEPQKKKNWIFSKGSPEKLFPLCKQSSHQAETAERTEIEIFKKVESMAQKGLRVLAIAYSPLREDAHLEKDPSLFEKDLTLIGLVGLMDPPRPAVQTAIQTFQAAGIRMVMITGDHPATAQAIAQKLGINPSSSLPPLTGKEMEKLSQEAFKNQVRKQSVYARVSPEQKIQIVKALQEAGEFIAMIGDGVNDAPALKRSNVGVAMGKGGTDVAREASSIILLDDHFETLVSAVQEGRRIYDNIRKFVRFALSGNSGEIWTLFFAPFLGLPIPLLPIHILWINLVTDGLPGIALALEPAEKNIMLRPPRRPQESLFGKGLWQHSLWVGILTAALTLCVLAWSYWMDRGHWQSMAFTVLTFTQMFHILAIRSETASLFTLGIKSNIPLFLAVLTTMGLQLGTLYVPWMSALFKTEPLSLKELMLCIGTSSVVLIAVEIEKGIQRFRNKKHFLRRTNLA